MSVVKRLQGIVRLPLSLLGAMAGWLLVVPLAAMVPKRRDWIAVIGRQDGLFLDNAKYFFLQTAQDVGDLRLVFVTEREDVAQTLKGRGVGVLRYPNWGAFWFLMRCGCVVADSVEWQHRLRRFLTSSAQVIQLWHGVGFKRIERDRWEHETGRVAWASISLIVLIRLLIYRLNGRRMRYTAVATTSRFYRDAVFAPAFLAQHFPVTGYPRNDFALSLHGKFRELAWMNVDARVKAQLEGWQRLGRKLVLIAPTFRDSGSVPMQLDVAALRAIDIFAEKHGVEFIFKFHLSERNADHIVGKHYHVCARDSDIYPLFPHVSALVTDYSSISMDFLLVDKPLLFLIPEDDDYVKKDRQLQFDPHTMMPGPVVPDWDLLLTALLAEWAHDTHTDERAILRSKAFDDLPQAEAVPKLLALMREQG